VTSRPWRFDDPPVTFGGRNIETFDKNNRGQPRIGGSGRKPALHLRIIVGVQVPKGRIRARYVKRLQVEMKQTPLMPLGRFMSMGMQ
jgi:hypothetical protein